jgi:ferredoxin/flavodoxin---NADP+ reductase
MSPPPASATRIAVVGAGPAGIFSADAIIKRHPDAVVDIIDKLPTPYGLVRYGVAPDNLKMKSVLTALAKVIEHPRVRFLGNVTYGTDITWEDLLTHYDGTVFATGAPETHRLGIPGEDLDGCEPAARIVSWYNGYPDHRHELRPGTREVAVIGAGNVSLDVARVLLKHPRELEGTDIPRSVLDQLTHSTITDVHIIARRGPAFARFSTAELREFDAVDDLDVIVRPEDLILDPRSQSHIDRNRNAGLVVDQLREWSARPRSGAAKRVHFRFAEKPVEVLGGGGRVEGLRLLPTAGERPALTLPVQLVLRSIGYRGVRLDGLPFNADDGTVPHLAGRVAGIDGPAFVAGWAKRGPSGVIGTNKACAAETAQTLLAHLQETAATAATRDLTTALRARGVPFVTVDDWRRIERLEEAAGRELGRGRVKLTTLADMLSVRTGR